MKKQKIIDGDWDNLIILDACRYDYFKSIFENFFDDFSTFEKRISRGSRTTQWFYNTFNNTHLEDVVYVSGNPYIQSGGQLKANERFFKVINVWDEDWNEKITTVHPKDLNKHFLTARSQYPNKRIISHYMQPHQPYITKEYRKYIIEVKENKGKSNKIKSLLGSSIWYFLKRLPAKMYWNLAQTINIPTTHACKIGMEEGMEGVKQAYKNNLLIVLKHISELTTELDGKTIVTADHGECLGEGGQFGHSTSVHNQKILREVPWLVV